jgi:hypothetical protein
MRTFETCAMITGDRWASPFGEGLCAGPVAFQSSTDKGIVFENQLAN